MTLTDLIKESNQLMRALNTDFKVASNENNAMPLMVYKEKLDSDLVDMRQMYEEKKRIIDECLAEQINLCNQLNEELRGLSTDPLASETDVEEFKSYLLDLKSEKLHRVNEIEFLKRKINDLCDEMDLMISESVHER